MAILRRDRHIVVTLSSHGYGHAAQTCAVLNALWDLDTSVAVTILTALPAEFLQNRLHQPIRTVPWEPDVGMEMASSIDVLREESAAAYRRFHNTWQTRDQALRHFLQQNSASLVLSNVAYLPLQVAAELGIPSVAMCSLNWADIYEHYCYAHPTSQAIVAQIRNAYSCADIFLQITPHMPMSWLERRRPVGPIARIGCDTRNELVRCYAVEPDTRLVLIGFGGIATRIPVDKWPPNANIRWLVPESWKLDRPDTITWESTGLSFIDLVASCDAILTKPGYGMFAEAACNRKPVVYVSRGDWPEEPHLVQWLRTHGRAQEVSRGALQSGNFADTLLQLCATDSPPAPTPTGSREVAEMLVATLDQTN